MARLSGKLTPKALGFDRAIIQNMVKELNDTQRAYVGRIVGIASGLRLTFNDKTGEAQTGLKGQFRGVSSLGEDGKAAGPKNPAIVVTAGVCYIPSGLQAMIEGALAKAQEADEKATVQFGMDLFVKRDTNAAGYTFDADTLVETSETDPLQALLTAAENAATGEAPAMIEGKAENKEKETA